MEYHTESLLSLISHIHSSAADFTNRLLSKKLKLVSSHGFILFLLAENEKLTMGQLSEHINRDKSTTTALIRKLTAAGLVTTHPCPEDNRKKFIMLTDEGKKYEELTSGISKELLAVCFKDFSEEEKENLLNLLLKMSSNFDK